MSTDSRSMYLLAEHHHDGLAKKMTVVVAWEEA